MNFDLVLSIVLVVMALGATTWGVLRARSGPRKSWVETMEAQRAERIGISPDHEV